MVPAGKSRNRKHLDTSAGLLPGDLLTRFVRGTEILGTTRNNSLPVNYQGAWCWSGAGKIQEQEAPGAPTSAGLQPGNFLFKSVRGIDIPDKT